jgi:LPXTG-motif cell wall-anchored protein
MTTPATSTSWLRNRIVAAGAALLAGAALAPAVLTPAAWATEPTDQETYETEEPAVVAEPSVRVAVLGLSYDPEADEKLLDTINAKRNGNNVQTVDEQTADEPTCYDVDGNGEGQDEGGANPEDAENPEDTTATPELAWSTTLARAAQERAAMCVLASGTDALSNALVAGTELSAGEQGTMKVSAVLVASATAADDDAEGATANDLVAGMLEELLAPSDDGTASALLDEADKTAGIATLTAGDTTYLVIVLSEDEVEVKDAVHCYTADETPTVEVPVAADSPRLTLNVEVAPTSSEEGFPAPGSQLVGDVEVLLDETPVQLVDGVTWTSSDERVLSVENSVFTVQGSGTVTLTASSGGVTLWSNPYTFDLVGPMAIDDDYDDDAIMPASEDGNGNNGETQTAPSVTYYSTQSVFYALRAEDGSYPTPSTDLNAAPENGNPVTVTSIDWNDPDSSDSGSYTLTGTGYLDDGMDVQVAQYVQRLDSLNLKPTAWSLTGSDENAVRPTALTGTYGDATVQVDVTWPELATQADGVSFQIEGLAANNATATFTVYVAAFTGAPTVAADQNGTDLPRTVQATYTDPADGSEHTIDLGLVWNTDGVDFATAAGDTVTVPATVTFPNGQTAQTSFEVSVEAAEEPAPTITAIAACDPITVELPATPELPGEVGVTYSDDTTATLPVTWDVDGVDFTVAGQYSVSGTVEGGGDLRASVSVTVNEAVPVIVQKATVQVSTPLGTAPVLPQTVEVTWSNGTVEDLAVTWNDGQELDAALYNTAQSFSVAGVLADDEHTPVTATVVVASPTSVQAPAPVTTDAGVAPQLPGSVVVVYSDGSTYEVAVSWDAVDANQYHTGGQFSVTGRASDTGLSTQVTVNVNDATVTGVQNNLAVQTVVLTAPQLPETASVRWSNGDTTSEAVAWNAVDPSSYAQVGTFTATGTVAGHQVSCTVTVTAAQSETPKTGDTTSIVPIVVGAVAGVAIVAAAIVLIVRSRKKR